MKYHNLTNDIKVSKICLGSMTFGSFCDEKQSFEILDCAYDMGVNFVDTAELYPSPPSKKTAFATEQIIGKWLNLPNNNHKKQNIIISSKISGKSPMASYIRDDLSFCKDNLTDAIDGSLKRLNKDCIDLYQPHWPDRVSNFFNIRYFPYHKARLKKDNIKRAQEGICNLVYALDEFVKSGKIRAYGVSNESAWGLMEYVKCANKYNLKKVCSIQNSFSLLSRNFEVALSEVCLYENISLLAYSPLAFGVLSGKYINKTDMPSSRVNTSKHYKRYSSNKCNEIVREYQKMANKLNISLSTLSLAFVLAKEFVASAIIGVSNKEQLSENIKAIECNLDGDILKQIDNIDELCPSAGV